MRYPEFLKPHGTIGLIAPSFGVSDFPYEDRFYDAVKKFKEKGYKIVEAEHLYGIDHAASASAEIRAKEFMDMYLNDDIDFIFSVAGGELMLSILPYIDFERIRNAKAKYLMGFSDNTCLTFTLNTICDVASIYGPCFGGFGMEPWDQSLEDGYEVLTGKKLKLNSYPKYEVKPEDFEVLPGHALDPYLLNTDVEYKTLDGKPVEFKGRLVGGCLDLLTNICGTKFDFVKEFIEKYKDDSIVWYLEACDLTVLDMYRSLWQLKNAGWFEHCAGIMFGRPANPQEMFDVDVKYALENVVGYLPVIYDMDFGHVQPSWSIISGSIAKVESKNGKGTISFSLD